MTAEVNAGLATLSDQLTLATVLLYVFAMIGYALDLGFGRSKARAGAQARRALVTAGAGTAAAPPAPAEGARAPRRRCLRPGRDGPDRSRSV